MLKIRPCARCSSSSTMAMSVDPGLGMTAVSLQVVSAPLLPSQKGWDENLDAIPGDLDPDAEEDECHDANDSVSRGGRNGANDLGCVGVAEVDTRAKDHDGDE